MSNSFSFDSKILIVGLVRNAEKTLAFDLKILNDAFQNFPNRYLYFVESDSRDSTLQILQNYSQANDSFDFVSLGNLDDSIPVREDRISYCRNQYLAALNSDPRYSQIDFLVVVDMDGVNSDLRASGVESCMENSDWGACFANQEKYYYDIYALRHQQWSPNDCWAYEKELLLAGVPHVQAREKAVYARQRKISPDSDWIPVTSAFGGLGIYDSRYLVDATYSSRNQDGSITCEHVSLNESISRQGIPLFINPKLINSRNNSHTSNRRFLNRIKWLTKLFLVKISRKFAEKPI
jgi:hypothetical protein